MAQLIHLMSAPVRTSTDAEQDLRLAPNVVSFDTLELLLTVYEASTLEVKIFTGMQTDSTDGWVELGTFSNTLGAGDAEKKTMSNPLAYIRWQVTVGGASSFMITGIGRQT